MLFFVIGANGSGKSACISHLKVLLNNSIIHDFDDIGVPKNADAIWRQQATEKWLQQYLLNASSYDSYVICGQAVLGEILACPSVANISSINVCLLDVSDVERINRLKKRGTLDANQNILNWSAWLRMHHHDPAWEQHVIKNNTWNGLNFSKWDKLTQWKTVANTTIIDTTFLMCFRSCTCN